jgi:RHS repeat-associated protein
MTTSKQYDKLNRLLSIASTPSGTGILPVSFSYQYNDANQRYRITLQDGSFWFYEYDNLGQLRSGKKFWSDGTPVPGQQFEYAHDDIGNRTQTKAGGDQNGAGLRSASYSANSLNQYTSRGVPGAVDILGIAPASASVTVNSSPADYRRGEYFQELVTVANGANPVWQAINVTTSGGGSASGNVFVPRTPEDFDDPATPSVNEGYDLDGNQLRDGRWNYTWDGENRLVKLESLASAPTGSKRRLEFEYDWQGRRIKKKVTNLDTGSVLLDNKFLYDSWNVVAELNTTNNAVIRSYMWGLDLSGTMQSAGGVGGLLAVKDSENGLHFASYDGNGNVAALVKATDGTISAQYEYAPFAEPIRVTGPMGKTNPIRFSTKYTDDESDFLYYGYRYYNPSTGRWLNRDPVGETGSPILYGFANNDSLKSTDFLGLFLTQNDHRNFQRFIDKLTIMIKNGEVSPCSGFAFLFGKLFELENKWWIGYARQWGDTLNDAVYYFTSWPSAQILGFTKVGSIQYFGNVTPPWKNNWTRPNWLSTHNNQGNKQGYIQYFGGPTDDDESGRHDHLIVNAWGQYMANTSPLGSLSLPSVQDTSLTDTMVNQYGRDLENHKGRWTREELNKWIYERICNEKCLKVKHKGPLRENIIK